MRYRRVLVGALVALSACTATGGESQQAPLPTTMDQQPGPSVTVVEPPAVTSSASPSPSTASTTTAPNPGPAPIEGWHPTGVDPDVFGAVTITDAVVADGTITAVGCPSDGEPGFPVWVSDDAVTWERATGPTKIGDFPIGCLRDVVVTPFGMFTHGFRLLRSTDGRVWEPVEFLSGEGHSRGNVDSIFAIADRLTVLLQQAAEAESTIATLFTTTDGFVWDEGPAGSADLFDSSGVGDVLLSEGGLIAVGASPWGEFVPSAAAWTSPDGVDWRLVTPRSDGFADAYMHTIVETEAGFIALGGSPFGTSLMAGWMSTDGINWTRLRPPTGDTAAQHGYMEAYAVSKIDIGIYAAGLDFDAGRAVQELPALWVSLDGVSWERHHVARTGGLIPFTVVSLGDQRVGFWPPPFWPVGEPVRVFIDDE